MEAIFTYDTYVTGKKFVGRKDDVRRFINLLTSGENIAVYGEPGVGKMSLIQESLTEARLEGMNLNIAMVDFTRVRKLEDVLVAFASGVIKAFAGSPVEYSEAVDEYLDGTHFVFDRERYNLCGDVIAPNWTIDELDIQKVFGLPYVMISEKLRSSQMFNAPNEPKLVVLVTQFQTVSLVKESFQLLKILEKAVEESGRNCSFVFTGSLHNAMRDIFDIQKWFWRSVERFAISPVAATDIADNIYRIFQSEGKVIEKEVIINAAQLLRCNMRYVNHLFAIADSFSRGYVNKNDADSALQILISIHRLRFFSTICSLTDFQLSLLRAIMAGEVRFSSSSIIDKYQLNSSANVNRLKDALVKKEVVWFDEKDEPHVVDPLFEYWLAKEYFV